MDRLPHSWAVTHLLLMQYVEKVSAERGLLVTSCYLIPKIHNEDANSSYTERKKQRQKKAKRGLKGLASI